MIGNQIENYKIISLLGEGGMANVYLAYDSKFESEVAIKVLKDEFVRNKEVRKRFIDEAKILYKISNVNIINVTDLIDAGDIVAFVMEYVDGQTVDQFVKQKAFSFFEINSIFNQMVSAIEYVHSVGLIHRDIKPSNFIISTDGNLKLFDFGIAKNVGFQLKDPNHTIVGQQIGTPSFMSPEQIENNSEITKQSDIYSLGVTLWYMVEGKSPYKLKSISELELKNKIVSELLPLTLTFWDDIIQNATKKKPEFRFIDKVKLNEAKDIDDTILDKGLKKKIISKKNKFFIFFSSLSIIILTFLIAKSSLFNNSSSVTKGGQRIDTGTDTIAPSPRISIEKTDTIKVKEPRKVVVEKQDDENKKTNKTNSITSDIQFTKFENVVDVESKVKNILIDLLPKSDSFRKLNQQRFDALLNFAFNNFSSILPTDKNSDEFIELCNLKNDLFFEMKKSKITFNKEKINTICL
jgi:serine/threonine protein kinase